MTGLFLLRSAVLAMVMFGALAEMPLVWKMADLSMGLMAVTNLIAIYFTFRRRVEVN